MNKVVFWREHKSLHHSGNYWWHEVIPCSVYGVHWDRLIEVHDSRLAKGIGHFCGRKIISWKKIGLLIFGLHTFLVCKCEVEFSLWKKKTYYVHKLDFNYCLHHYVYFPFSLTRRFLHVWDLTHKVGLQSYLDNFQNGLSSIHAVFKEFWVIQVI